MKAVSSASPPYPKGKTLALLLSLWAVATLYNLFKPFHIDDVVHLLIAQWISANPWRPMSGTLDSAGVDIFATNQPHLYFYGIALWGSLFGFSEVPLHIFQSLFALACIFLFYFLALELAANSAIWATAMLVLGPTFIVEQNLMVDVPLLAFWLLFFVAIIGGVSSENQNGRYLVAALACSMAILIKYSSLVLLVILLFSLIVERRWSQLWCLAIPVATIGGWSAFNYWDFGKPHIFGRNIARRGWWASVLLALAWISALGSSTPLGLILLRRLAPATKTVLFILPAAALAILATAVATGAINDTRADLLLAVFFIANGLVMFLAFVLRGIVLVPRSVEPPAARTLQQFYLVVWIADAFAFYCLLAPFMAARHLLLTAPAFLLLFCSSWPEAFDRKAKAFGLAFTIAIAAGLCVSDWRFAEFYKEKAQTLAGFFPTGATVWTSGQWGWQWYARQQGFNQVDVVRSQLRPGDYLIVADGRDHQNLTFEAPMRLVRRVEEAPSLLNLFCTARPVRFYASGWRGSWSLSRACVHRIGVYQIEGPQAKGADGHGETVPTESR